jgi:membrane-bound metal-dependent hydrolase YbcI (DUF457 family)
MNKPEHIAIGIIAFLIFTGLYSVIKIPVNWIGYGFIGVIIGSILPDILEPAKSWMHRGVGHSKRTLKMLGMIFAVNAILALFSFFINIFSIFYVISCCLLGYIVHLLADATTNVGLPD